MNTTCCCLTLSLLFSTNKCILTGTSVVGINQDYLLAIASNVTLWDKQMEFLNVSGIINANGWPWIKTDPKGSGSLPAPRSGYAATVIDWDIVLCYVLKYKGNTHSCDLYLHVIMTLRPTASHSCLL